MKPIKQRTKLTYCWYLIPYVASLNNITYLDLIDVCVGDRVAEVWNTI